jgi:hypothetical protein
MAFVKTFSALAFISLLAACGQQNTYNDDAQKNYAQEAQVKKAQLAPAAGDWCGKMQMTSGNSFAVEISVQPLPVAVQAPSSQDPNLIAEQFKLAGAMKFPILDGASSTNYSNHPDIAGATGGAGQVSLANGDYYPQNEPQVTLPFSVTTSAQSVYGVVQGDLVNGHFIGTWTANSNQKVGDFDLQQICSVGGAS